LIRPTTAILAIFLDLLGVYHDGDFGWYSGFFYLLFLVNCSVAYAFLVLANFYTVLKHKLAPYEPVGKFLCIKFVIFMTFWQVCKGLFYSLFYVRLID